MMLSEKFSELKKRHGKAWVMRQIKWLNLYLTTILYTTSSQKVLIFNYHLFIIYYQQVTLHQCFSTGDSFDHQKTLGNVRDSY